MSPLTAMILKQNGSLRLHLKIGTAYQLKSSKLRSSRGGMELSSDMKPQRQNLQDDIIMDETPSWGNPGGAQADFRTDSHTVPSTELLNALIKATLYDDVFREDTSTQELEANVATMTGCEDGCLALTGTMANQIALRVLFQQPPYSLLTDSRAHIINYEAGGPAYLTGAMIQAIRPSNNLYLTLEDIKRHAILTDDVQKAPTKVISLENPAHGAVTPLDEMQKVSTWARENDIRLHLDAARLFDAIAVASVSIRDYCTLFDTVYLDFSKNLGAPFGTIILGSKETIIRARRIRKALGGGFRPTGIISSMVKVAIELNFGWDGYGEKAHQMRKSHEMAKRIGNKWVKLGGELIRGVETNIVWLNIRKAGYNAKDFNRIGDRTRVKLDGSRIVVHYQISEEGIQRLFLVFAECLGSGKNEGGTHTPERPSIEASEYALSKL